MDNQTRGARVSAGRSALPSPGNNPLELIDEGPPLQR